METTITVNLKERSFTISGTEEFVEKNKQELKDFIMMNIKQEETTILNKNEKEEKKSTDHSDLGAGSDSGSRRSCFDLLCEVSGKKNCKPDQQR